MSKLFHTVGVVWLLAMCIAVPFRGHAQSTQNPPQENTFGGAIAPAHRPTETGQPPEGYRGVIPGHVGSAPQQPVQAQPPDDEGKPVKRMPRAQAPADQGDDAATPPRKHAMSKPGRGMSKRPGFPQNDKPMTAEDLKQIAAMTGIEIRLDKIPDRMAETIHLPEHVYPVVALPQQRVDGMLPLEFTAKQMVDKEQQDIDNAAKISPEAREKAVKDAIVILSTFARGARLQRDMPAEIYAMMGLPKIYLEETKEASGKAAERLETALKTLENPP